MTKDELISHVAKEANITQKAADIALKTILNSIAATVCKGNQISFAGFGAFGAKERKARVGTHPKTKEILILRRLKCLILSLVTS